jgi:suppressor for copper-sensitivity B
MMLAIKKLFQLVLMVVFINISLQEDGYCKEFIVKDYGEVSLVPIEFIQGKDDRKLTLGLRFKLNNGWKIYGREPGSLGLPLNIKVDIANNIKTPKVKWPIPRIDYALDEISYIYEKKVTIPITAMFSNDKTIADVVVEADYLVCNEVCLPDKVKLDTQVKFPYEDENEIKALNEIYKATPKKNGNNGLTIKQVILSKNDDENYLQVHVSSTFLLNNPHLIIEPFKRLSFAKPNIYIKKNKLEAIFEYELPSDIALDLDKEKLRLTLINNYSNAVEDVWYPEKIPNLIDKTGFIEFKDSNNKHLSVILFLALLGGFILNFMPCVLPVLSIKLLGVINQYGNDKLKIRKNFLASSFGIVASFLVFAVITIALQMLGKAVGFGFHFQQPLFLLILIWVMLFFAFNLHGMFEINIPNWLSKGLNNPYFSSNNEMVSNFLSGAFAALLATPCTAPFLGTAVSFAFSREVPLEIISIFVFIGLGLALPYLLLSVFPSLISLLPKPGAWMLKLRFALGIFLLVSAFWLIWVFSNQVGYLLGGIIFLFAILVKLVLKRNISMNKKNFYTILLILCSFLVTMLLSSIKSNQAEEGKFWRAFNKSLITSYVNDGKVVIVDVTADWCLACKYNKLTVLNSKEIIDLLKQDNIIAMRADITSPDLEIRKYLQSFNRYGIPFNIVYGPNAKKGVLLPEILTKKIVINAISKAK